MRNRFFAIAAASIVLLSCKQEAGTPRRTIPFVREIIADGSRPEHDAVAGLPADMVGGAVAVFGAGDRCEAVREAFLRWDSRDNVDGRHVPDRLPDFCGETLSVIIDAADTPYKGYLDAGNEEFLRELAVKGLLSSLDTACHISTFDKDGIVRKKSSKIMILESAFMAPFGSFDADSLLQAAGSGVKVVTPLGAMVEDLVSARKGASVNFGVIADRAALASGIYSTYLSQQVRFRGVKPSECVAFLRNKSGDVLTGFLDNYLAAGYTAALDAILVDDFNVSVHDMKRTLELILSDSNPELDSYRHILSPGFMILDGMSSLMEDCFDFMRKRNLFTHDVHYPVSETYVTVPVPNLPPESYDTTGGGYSEAYRYGRAGNSGTQAYLLLHDSRRLKPEKQETADVQD